jgi:Ni/Fe-hydrogenase subunit HybB-like protein
MFVYLFLKAVEFLHGQHWTHMSGFYGAWFLVEVGALVALPMTLFLYGASRERIGLIRTAAIISLVGVILNRLNISIIAFKWYDTAHYVPSWMEMVVTVAVICAEIWVFRWVIKRMPVLGKRPAWAESTSH